MERVEATADQIERARRGESSIVYKADRMLRAGSDIAVYNADQGVLVGKISVPSPGLYPGDTITMLLKPHWLL